MLKNFTSHGDLTFATIHQHQIRQTACSRWHLPRFLGLLQGLGELAVSTHQDLSHCGVIVTRRDALNAIATVLGALHFVLMEHHARSLGSLTGGMRDVKAFNPEFVEIVQSQIQSIGQCTRTGLLRALFGQQTGQLQARVGLRHFKPHTSLLARLMNSRDLNTGLNR